MYRWWNISAITFIKLFKVVEISWKWALLWSICHFPWAVFVIWADLLRHFLPNFSPLLRWAHPDLNLTLQFCYVNLIILRQVVSGSREPEAEERSNHKGTTGDFLTWIFSLMVTAAALTKTIKRCLWSDFPPYHSRWLIFKMFD